MDMKTSTKRIARRWLLGLVLATMSIACAHTPAGGGASFRVDANVADATVWVDDVLVGKASDWSRDDRHIRAGFHRVEIRSPGYYSVYQEIEPLEGGHVAIKAELRPVLD
jgi:hypothetical protein